MNFLFPMLLAAVNPVVGMFPNNVTFYAGFNGETIDAEIGATGPINPSWKCYTLSPDGLFGSALQNGMPQYAQRDDSRLLDTTKPGTVVIWTRLNCKCEPNRRGLASWEGGGGFFEIMGDKCRLLVMKSVDCQWGGGQVWCFAEGRDKFDKHVSCNAGGRLSYTDWEIGQWKMIAASWDAEKLYMSVDGGKISERPHPFRLGDMRGSVIVRATYWNPKNPEANLKPAAHLVDEVAVFNRRLAQEELKELYERTRKAAKIADGRWWLDLDGKAYWIGLNGGKSLSEASVLWGGGEPEPAEKIWNDDGSLTLRSGKKSLTFTPTSGNETEVAIGAAKAVARRIAPLPARPDLEKVRWTPALGLVGADGGLGAFEPLVKTDNGAAKKDLVSRYREFKDFRLVFDFKAPKDFKGGVYLRGVYRLPLRPSGDWQKVDAVICDRHLTLKVDGVTVLDNAGLQGVSGGALTGDERKPGPVFLRGDQSNAAYRSMTLTPILVEGALR